MKVSAMQRTLLNLSLRTGLRNKEKTMKRLVAFSASLLALMLCFARPAFAASTTTITVGTVPKFVAVNQTTNRIYVSNPHNKNVSVIDGATHTAAATGPAGTGPDVLDANPITNLGYLA